MTRLNIDDQDMPGLARAKARGAVQDDLQAPLEPRPRSEIAEWAKKNVTVQNAFLLLVLLFQAGGWWQKQQTDTQHVAQTVSALEIRLEVAETASKLSADAVSSIYVRRDVIEERLRSMDARLANIETWMRNNGKDR